MANWETIQFVRAHTMGRPHEISGNTDSGVARLFEGGVQLVGSQK
jgi:hypothetical protein